MIRAKQRVIRITGGVMERSTGKVVPFPTVAEPNIETVLKQFLEEQKERLKPRTYRRYEEIVSLFEHCLNLYGYQELESSSESALYIRLSDYKNLSFCVIFGPEKMLTGLSTFLGYFMIRKVVGSESLLRSAGTVTKKLIKWLLEREYVGKPEASRALQIAGQAARELPAAERLARLLYDYAQTHAPRHWTAELDDYFTVEEVAPNCLMLTGVSNETGLVEVKVPTEIAAHCKVGWQINLLLGETRNGWRILETGNVYPM